MDVRKGKAPGFGHDDKSDNDAAKPKPERRRLKRRATDSAPPADKAARHATDGESPGTAGRLKSKSAIRRNVTGARVGYDPYESGQLVKQKRPGVRRDLRSLGQWLKSRKEPKNPR